MWIFSPTDPVLPEENVREFYALDRWPRKGFALIFRGILAVRRVVHRCHPGRPQGEPQVSTGLGKPVEAAGVSGVGLLACHRVSIRPVASSQARSRGHSTFARPRIALVPRALLLAPKRRRALVSMSHKGPSFDRSGDAPIDTLRLRPRPPITRLPRRIAPPYGPSSPSCPALPKENVREVLCPRIEVAQGFPQTFFGFYRGLACRPQDGPRSSTETPGSCTESGTGCGEPT